jgi:SOS-response transcriptional repressor LexA
MNLISDRGSKPYRPRDISPAQVGFLEAVYLATMESGWPPTQREMGRRIKASSSSTASWFVDKLENSGHLETNKTSPGIRLTEKGVNQLFQSLNLLPELVDMRLDKVYCSVKQLEGVIGKDSERYAQISSSLAGWVREYRKKFYEKKIEK